MSLYDLLSITKGAVGLAFLSAKIDLNEYLFMSGATSTTVGECLNHFTGVEDDSKFDWKLPLELRDKSSMVTYCSIMYLEKYLTEFKRRGYAYNNVVWCILCDRFRELYGESVSSFINITGPGISWERDVKGDELGFRGLLLDDIKLKEYSLLAEKILRKNLAKPTNYIPKDNWVTEIIGNYPVYPFYGWFVAEINKRDRVAVSIGYGAQFICVSTRLPVETQARSNPDIPPTTKELNFVKRFIGKH